MPDIVLNLRALLQIYPKRPHRDTPELYLPDLEHPLAIVDRLFLAKLDWGRVTIFHGPSKPPNEELTAQSFWRPLKESDEMYFMLCPSRRRGATKCTSCFVLLLEAAGRERRNVLRSLLLKGPTGESYS